MIKTNSAKFLRRPFRYFAIAAMLAAVLGCNSTVTTDPIIVYYSGSITVSFNWIGGVPSCAECVSTYARAHTAEMGDFNYGPFTFSYDGVFLSQVLGGYDRTITVWVTNNSGDILYRGVLTGLHITSGVINPAVTADIYAKGWYALSVSQPSADWGFEKVRMSGDGSGWAAGSDTAEAPSTICGVVFQGGNDLWAMGNVPVTSSDNWVLHSIAPSGAGAWAVGEDKQHTKGIILRNDGAIWHDDISVPDVPLPWSLRGVDFSGNGAGWAVGESRATTPESGVVLKYDPVGSSWSLLNTPNYVLNDVAIIATGEFIAGGEDKNALAGIVIHWNQATYDVWIPTSTVMSICTGESAIKNVRVVSDNEWWAAGTCYNPDGSFGFLFHYTVANGLLRDNITGPSGSWTLNGVWADSSGEAWAVGNTPTTPVILRRSGGLWSEVTPVIPPAGSVSWTLESVDFPATGWGYAVGTDLTNKRGVVLRYGFPK